MKKKVLLSIGIIILLTTTFGKAYASDQIFITISGTMKNVIFDGRWTFYEEWKESSLNTFTYPDGTNIVMRSAHYGNSIYFFIDDLSNTSFYKGSDRAVICLNMNDNRTIIPNSNDYCFMTALASKVSYIMQGGSFLASSDYYKKINNPGDFMGISAVSDINDRYSLKPHASYEFKIPTDLVGRSNLYGMYVGIYHTQSNRVYSWPFNSTEENSLQIPSPTHWGELVSPDKTLPEFNLPTIVISLSFILVLYQIRKIRTIAINL